MLVGLGFAQKPATPRPYGPRQKLPMMMRSLTSMLSRRFEREDGQALIEYALLLALVAIVSIGVLNALGVDIKNLLNQVSTRMSQVSNP